LQSLLADFLDISKSPHILGVEQLFLYPIRQRNYLSLKLDCFLLDIVSSSPFLQNPFRNISQVDSRFGLIEINACVDKYILSPYGGIDSPCTSLGDSPFSLETDIPAEDH
jgi:hypothetical protein